MNLCFPVSSYEGIQGAVFGHFGSAPEYLICDLEGNDAHSVPNIKHNHERGKCDPASSIRDENVEAVITGGIGANALIKLNQAGIKVYSAVGESITENIEAYKSGNLKEFVSTHVCNGYSNKSGCGHH
jgi:predicted Fe-Mo cluster-binding NifX family protein